MTDAHPEHSEQPVQWERDEHHEVPEQHDQHDQTETHEGLDAVDAPADGPEDEGVAMDHEAEHLEAEHLERAATQLSVLPTPVPGATGVPGVDGALDRLAELPDLEADPEAHVAVLEDVHERLQGALSGPDESAP